MSSPHVEQMDQAYAGQTTEAPHTKSLDDIAHEAMIDVGDLDALEKALEIICKNERLVRQFDRHLNTTGKDSALDVFTQIFGMVKIAKIRTEQRVKNAQ